MRLNFWAATDVGKTRDHNEDNFLVDKNLRLFVVADGMGGHAAGEVASSLCVRRVRDAVAGNNDLIERCNENSSPAVRGDMLRMLEHAVQAACSSIYQRAQRQPEKRGMGTTCTVLLLAGNRGFIAHVGDSRIYLMRQGLVHQLSEDHSLVNELVRRGKLKPEEIDSSPYKDYKNAMTRAVGVYESVEVDTLDFDILPGDNFLLCSDGLHGYLDDNEEKLSELLSLDDVKLVTSSFIDFANKSGGADNITNVVVRVEAAEAEDQRTKELTLKIEALKGMPIFRYLNYKELVRVMNITEVEDFGEDEQIFEEGSMGSKLYILLEGKIRLHKGETFITSLDAGDHFGEMAMVDAEPRSASATAEGPARLLSLDRAHFYDIIRNETQVSVKLLWSFVQVLANRLRKTTADLSGARFEASLPDLTDEAFFEDTETGSRDDLLATLAGTMTLPGMPGLVKKDTITDATSADATISDATIADATIADAAIADAAISDAAISDAAIADAAISDAATSDAAISDATIADAAISDAATSDATAADGADDEDQSR